MNQDSLSEGEYYLQVTDVMGCITVDSITLIDPDGIELTDTIFSKSRDGMFNINCFGGNEGSIDVNLTGGSGQYFYEWTTINGNGLVPEIEDQSGLTAGDYHLRVWDESGCERNFDFTLTQPDPIHFIDTLSISIDGNYNVNCAGGNDGSILLYITGGSIGNYRYQWSTDNGSGLVNGLQHQNGLSAGEYHITVTDTNQCFADTTIILTEPLPISTEITPTHISCDPGYDDGAIQLDVSGGTGPGTYSYLWSNSATTKDLSDLTAGWYTVEVTDINMCVKSDSVEILLPPDLIIDVNVSDYNGSNVTCFGDNNGFISTNILSGTPGYTFTWNGPGGFTSDQPDIQNLYAGSYTLNVVDAKNCMGDTTIQIVEPAPFRIEITTTSSITGGYNLNCFGDSTASIELQVTGGTPDYQYLWNTGDVTRVIFDLGAGEYLVTIKDVNNCMIDTTITLIQPQPLTLQLGIKDTYCPDMSDGEVIAFVTGGVEPYDYLWSTGETGDRILNVIPSEYNLKVSDANLCEIADTFKVKSERPQCLEIPTAFSPNGDGVNDIWEIGRMELYPDAVVEIFNRWGELMFRSSRGYSIPWDGTRNGKALPMDSYHYIIDLHNGTKPVIGSVTIVR